MAIQKITPIIDGDQIDVDWNPTNYTPSTVTETTSVDHLSSHLKGIDDKIVYSAPYDVVGGRLDLVSATSIKWGFQNSNQIRLVNPDTGRWELVKVTTEPTLANTALDLNGTALAVDKIYDVFAEYSSSTAFTLKCSRWASYGAGTSSRVAAYASGTTYAIGDRVTYGGHDWVKQSSAAAGTTPVAGNDWVDNGTSVSGDFSGLYRHDGVLVSDSSDAGKSRRWLGIIYTYNNGGTVNFKDEETLRYISNFYNRKLSSVKSYNSTSSWTYSTASWRESNSASGQVRGYVVSCNGSSSVLQRSFYVYCAATGYGGEAIALNGSMVMQLHTDFGTPIGRQLGSLVMNVSVPIGYNYITSYEAGDGTTNVTHMGGINSNTSMEIEA